MLEEYLETLGKFRTLMAGEFTEQEKQEATVWFNSLTRSGQEKALRATRSDYIIYCQARDGIACKTNRR